jgi:hypothetical protein
MSRQEAYSVLRANQGKALEIVLDGNRVAVTVASVDTDGALFRTVEPDPLQPLAEFWVAFDHIERIELRHSAAN